MHRFLVSFTATAGLVSATSSAICSSYPYNLVLPFSTYAPAQSFCSSRYPVAPVTVTATVAAYATSTVIATQTALTTQVIQSTVVTTEIDSVTVDVTASATTDSTVLSTEIDTVTVTVTITPGAAKVKRSGTPTPPLLHGPPRPALTTAVGKRELEARTVKSTTTSTTLMTTTSTSSKPALTTSKTTSANAQASLWSSIAAQASSLLSTGCSCIETPKTVTATQTSTNSATITNTITVTNVATSTSLGLSTTTTTATITATITETATVLATIATTTDATATTTQTACVAGPTTVPGFYCSFNVLCDTTGTYPTDRLAPNAATTFNDCLIQCNYDFNCGGVNFDEVTNTCVLIDLPAASANAAGAAAYTAVPNPLNEFAYYTGGCPFNGY